MENDFKPIATVTMVASNKKDIDKQIRKYQAQTQANNPHSEVKLEVEPNPDKVGFKDYEATRFSVTIYLKYDE